MKPRASTTEILRAIDAEIDVQTMEEMPVAVLGADGRIVETASRRRRCHIGRDKNDREGTALPDEPPPGWCET